MLSFFCGIGITYAYFAFNYENDSVIVGNVMGIDADLSVELVVGNNEGLVPMMDAALSNAINGVGTDNGACIDSLGNLSCQVYKITLTNNGSRLQHLVGAIELYAKEGSGNVYSNLKWQELSDTTTVKDGSIVNNMSKSILVSGLTLESKESKTWYVGVWLSEIDSDQREFDKGEFQGTVTFEVNEEIGEGIVGSMYKMNVFAETYMVPEASLDDEIDFSQTSEASGTNGVYLRNGTENDNYPIYYYRGDVDNNLIFADFCWKVVRTTETGGLKLIYNGVPTDGQCNNTGEASQIGTSSFNSIRISPTYAGYMYGDVYEYTIKDMSSDTTEYIYGNNINYSGGTYTLTNGTVKTGDWSNIYSEGLNNYHYTCFTTGIICTSVYYIYHTASSEAYYITLNGEDNIEEALSKMLDYNTNSSTIKGNKDTEGTIDYWYYNNIESKGYKNYIEDTVWCNDRSISQLNGWNPNGGSMSADLRFGAYNRVVFEYSPTLNCLREIDKFTVNEEFGNGDLDYPVGLLTADEIMLAGSKVNTNNSLYYLYTGVSYWSGSSYSFGVYRALVSNMNPSGNIGGYSVNYSYGVRPSISLKNGFSLTGDGDGSLENPYIVE